MEISDNFATLESRLRNENLNPKCKFCAYGVDETWMYEEPQTTTLIV
jgi:hypothetical protein